MFVKGHFWVRIRTFLVTFVWIKCDHFRHFFCDGTGLAALLNRDSLGLLGKLYNSGIARFQNHPKTVSLTTLYKMSIELNADKVDQIAACVIVLVSLTLKKKNLKKKQKKERKTGWNVG